MPRLRSCLIPRMHCRRLRSLLGHVLPALILLDAQALAQMVTGSRIPGFHEAFGLSERRRSGEIRLHQLRSTPPANVAWPGEHPVFVFRLENASTQALHVD